MRPGLQIALFQCVGVVSGLTPLLAFGVIGLQNILHAAHAMVISAFFSVCDKCLLRGMDSRKWDSFRRRHRTRKYVSMWAWRASH